MCVSEYKRTIIIKNYENCAYKVYDGLLPAAISKHEEEHAENDASQANVDAYHNAAE